MAPLKIIVLQNKIENKMEKMEIIPGVEAIGASLWFAMEKILVIGDIHMGYEESLAKRGMLVPRVQFKETIKNIGEILGRVKPEMIIINGDLKHEFGKISDQEWLDTSRFLDVLSKGCKKILIVKGNHDTVLGPIAKRNGVEFVDYCCFKLESGENKINSVCVLHGDVKIEDPIIKKSDLLVIGHEHPAILLEEGPKREKFKCFLLKNFGKQKMIVMPSFLPIIEGTNVKREKFLSPYLQEKLDMFEVFIVGDKVYRFGRLKNL